MPNDNVLTVPRDLLQDLIDDVSDYAASREFKPREKAWRDDVLARARALLATPLLEPRAEVTEEQPSLTNPLTPYGMLVRALRIVTGTTLMDMAKALLTTPAKLSAMEFGREPVTPEFEFDVAAYFDALGVHCTESALRVAAAARAGEAS